MITRSRFSSHGYEIHLGTEFGQGKPLGGVQDATVADYRNGTGGQAIPRLPGIHKVGDVTLKRGVVDSSSLWNWLAQARAEGPHRRWDVTITLCDKAGQPILSWKLRNAKPRKYTGPTLGGRGSGDAAMEELVLSAESIELVPPHK